MNMFIPSLHHHLRSMRGKPKGANGDASHKSTRGPKRYERMDVVPLPPPTPLNMSLAEALSQRQTQRTWSVEKITLADIASLFFHGAHKNRPHRRPYPSCDGLYPVEIYLVTFLAETCERSVLHYEPDTHILRRLWEVPPAVHADTLIKIEKNGTAPSALIVLTAVWERNEHTYNRFAYVLALLEAGHLSQNLCLCAEALSLGICPFGGFNDEKIAELLDLDHRYEQPLHVLALGKTKT